MRTFSVLVIISLAFCTLAEDGEKDLFAPVKIAAEKETSLDHLIVYANIFLKKHSTEEKEAEWVKQFEQKYKERDMYYKEKYSATAELNRGSFLTQETSMWFKAHSLKDIKNENKDNIITSCRYLIIWVKTKEIMSEPLKDYLVDQIGNVKEIKNILANF
jgi:hypothetical protein